MLNKQRNSCSRLLLLLLFALSISVRKGSMKWPAQDNVRWRCLRRICWLSIMNDKLAFVCPQLNTCPNTSSMLGTFVMEIIGFSIVVKGVLCACKQLTCPMQCFSVTNVVSVPSVVVRRNPITGEVFAESKPSSPVANGCSPSAPAVSPVPSTNGNVNGECSCSTWLQLQINLPPPFAFTWSVDAAAARNYCNTLSSQLVDRLAHHGPN